MKKMNVKVVRNAIITLIFLFYYLLGYVLNIEMLKPITTQENGFTINFLGFILLFVTTGFAFYLFNILKVNKKTATSD
ncbi:hypothetical protein [Alkalihalobacillus pseudalcaliphilus]|uniref:hypothetical protein n=1 Tax=Alkalihalobacillus pseudalcaliphilus TaxID=79884 RepID=UPI00235EB109|nr:hypothetical protein [Alkalihalobacillus pseudalcaliphilus]